MSETFRFIVEDGTYLDTDTEIESEQDFKKRMKNKLIYVHIDLMCKKCFNSLKSQWRKQTSSKYHGRILINPRRIRSTQFFIQNYKQLALQFFRNRLNYKLKIQKQPTIRLSELIYLCILGRKFILRQQQSKMQEETIQISKK